MKKEPKKMREQLRCAQKCQDIVRRNLYWQKICLSVLEGFGRWLTRYEAGDRGTLVGLPQRSKPYRRRLSRETQRGLQLVMDASTRRIRRMRTYLRTNGKFIAELKRRLQARVREGKMLKVESPPRC
jgi:hypothetical protein